MSVAWKVLLQVAQNSSAGNSSTNKSLKTDDATFETSTLSWSNFQVRLLMLGVMALFFAACAAAWWFSFQHPDAFRLFSPGHHDIQCIRIAELDSTGQCCPNCMGQLYSLDHGLPIFGSGSGHCCSGDLIILRPRFNESTCFL